MRLVIFSFLLCVSIVFAPQYAGASFGTSIANDKIIINDIAFEKMDKNKSEGIDREEYTPSIVKHYYTFDENKDDVVFEDEYVLASYHNFKKAKEPTGREDFLSLNKAFKSFDSDKDGKFTKDEFLKIHQDEFFDADTNKDNEISRQEIKDDFSKALSDATQMMKNMSKDFKKQLEEIKKNKQ